MMTQLQEIYSVFKEHPSISTDSRIIKKGDIFFALKGPNFDANKLALQAIEDGASFAVVDDHSLPESSQIFKVSNVLETLQQLGALHRSEMSAKVLAITGSNGKTTTKELIAKVLAKKYKIIYTEGNLNNHIGVPLTLLRIKPDTEIAVIEMGANHMGEIRKLCLLARPDYGIITNIGKAHLEGFGSLTGVINAKSEMYSYIDDNGGMLFVNQDNELLNRLSANINRFTFGSELSSNLYCELINADPFLHIAWEYKGMQSVTATKIIGTYNAENLFCAIAVGCFLDISQDDIEDAISNYAPSNNRSQLIETLKNKIIMDAYNANPVSMEAAIRNFERIRGNKSIVILGDMLELGEESDYEHANILKLLTDLDFAEVILVGPLFERVYGGDDWQIFSEVDSLCKYLEKHPLKNYEILIKGSRGIHLEKVLPLL